MPSVDEVLGPGSPLARRLAGYEHREGQLAMARSVYDALAKDQHLFVEAGTGTGKTLAYLVPALLSGKRVVVSTATHALQEQIFRKDIPLVRDVLAEHGIVFRTALMKGLSNYLCKRRFAERFGAGENPRSRPEGLLNLGARGRGATSGESVSSELVRIERWAHGTQTGDRSELVDLAEGAASWRDVMSSTETRVGAGCKYYEECFVTSMRREAEQANVIVVNHHLFFADLALRTGKAGGFGGAIPNFDAVVFDEAHQIESVATDFFGVRLSTARTDALLRDARRAIVAVRVLDSHSMGVIDAIEERAAGFFRAFPRDRMEDSRRVLAQSDWTPARKGAAHAFDAALEELLLLAMQHEDDDAMIVLARRLGDLRSDLGRVLATSRSEQHWEDDEPDSRAAFEGGVAWVDTRERSVSIGASPVDLAPMLREKLFDRVSSVICTSATLATTTHVGPSFHFAKGRLGARPDAAEVVVPSPFDFAARAGLYVATDLPEPNAPGFDGACAERVTELARITGGGAFVLCTSNRAMRAIHGALRGRLPGPLLIQGEAPKHVLLDRFREAGDAVLVATMSFWEGVDVPGRALRLVVLDKIPFAVPTEPVVAARCAKIEAEGGNPFSQYSVPSAAITLKQGFGRLIRSREDSGVVALLDRRADKRGYGKSLLASLPPARRIHTLEEVRDFWHAMD